MSKSVKVIMCGDLPPWAVTLLGTPGNSTGSRLSRPMSASVTTASLQTVVCEKSPRFRSRTRTFRQSRFLDGQQGHCQGWARIQQPKTGLHRRHLGLISLEQHITARALRAATKRALLSSRSFLSLQVKN